jgi:hypothetical protein
MLWICMGEWRYSSTILDLGTKLRWLVSWTPQSFYPRGRTLGGPHSRSGRNSTGIAVSFTFTNGHRSQLIIILFRICSVSLETLSVEQIIRTSKGNTLSEGWIGRNVTRSGRGLIWGTIPELARKTWEKQWWTSVRTTGLRVWTRHFQIWSSGAKHPTATFNVPVSYQRSPEFKFRAKIPANFTDVCPGTSSASPGEF